MAFQTEFEFTLPKGYVDENGDLHRNGRMRLATAADEILPLRDPRVQQNAAYLTVILFSRVIIQLGTIKAINTQVIEDMFSADLAFLQEFYRNINEAGSSSIKAVCPECGKEFDIETASVGEF